MFVESFPDERRRRDPAVTSAVLSIAVPGVGTAVIVVPGADGTAALAALDAAIARGAGLPLEDDPLPGLALTGGAKSAIWGGNDPYLIGRLFADATTGWIATVRTALADLRRELTRLQTGIAVLSSSAGDDGALVAHWFGDTLVSVRVAVAPRYEPLELHLMRSWLLFHVQRRFTPAVNAPGLPADEPPVLEPGHVADLDQRGLPAAACLGRAHGVVACLTWSKAGRNIGAPVSGGVYVWNRVGPLAVAQLLVLAGWGLPRGLKRRASSAAWSVPGIDGVVVIGGDAGDRRRTRAVARKVLVRSELAYGDLLRTVLTTGQPAERTVDGLTVRVELRRLLAGPAAGTDPR